MKRRLEAAVVLCGALATAGTAGDAVAQEGAAKQGSAPQEKLQRGTPQERLDRARFIETSERFPMGAIDVYLTVAKDGAATPELRGKAWLAIARCRQQLGHVAEAKAALEAAVTEGGATGEEAKRLLAGGLPDERTQRRVDAAIVELQRQASTMPYVSLRFQDPPCSDLVLLGEASVTPLARLIDANLERSVVVEASVRLLVEIGGTAAAEAVARLVASNDVVLRRAVINGINQDRSGAVFLVAGVSQEPMRSALLRLTEDPDPRLRFDALRGLITVMNEPELLACASHREEWVRVRAIERAWKLAEQEPATATRGLSPEFLAVLRAAMTDESLVVRKAVANVLDEPALLLTPSGRELYLEALTRRELREPTLSPKWLEAAARAESDWFAEAPSAARLLEVARAASAVDGALPPAQKHGPMARGALAFLVGACVQLRDRPDPWPADHPVLFELGQVVGWGAIETWAAWHARAEDLPALCEFVASGDRGAASVVLELAKRHRELQPELRRRCVEALVVGVRASREAGGQAGASEKLVDAARESALNSCGTLIDVGWPEADRAVVEQVAADPTLYRSAVEYILHQPDQGRSIEVLEQLLVLPAAKHATGPQNEIDYAERSRSRLVVELARRGAANLPSLMAAAYRVGLAQDFTGADWLTSGNLAPLLLERTAGDRSRGRFAARFEDRALAAMVGECAATGVGQFWDDLLYLLETLARDDVPAATRSAMQRAIGAALPRVVGVADERQIESLIQRYVGDRAAGWEEFAVAAIDIVSLADPLVRRLPSMPAALLPKVLARASSLDANALANVPQRLLASKEPAVRGQLVALLRHEVSTLRERSVYAAADAFPMELLKAAPALARDESQPVRAALAWSLGRIFDRAAIPPLVELLRDGDAKVREQARASLDGLQYYFDSAQKWERLKAGTSLDATSAAEALVKQARSGATVELRKAAIDSLGTLKVPETLPFLLELMADPDPTLAAAARAAIAKINE
ncbi:MAG: HEAT repeat domain-containing protein [Planctomycetes bacterium]|nr:HEAT repeat domain-containing protein [Planctomycetota bacterium]